MMETYIGWGRSNESGLSVGGKPGDQLQEKTPDFDGEVSLTILSTFLNKSSDGNSATIYRTVDPTFSDKIGEGMNKACNNPYIGYDANNRLSILAYGVYSGKNGKGAECDDTSLARVVIKYGSKIDLGDFNRDSVRRIFNESKLFLDPIEYTESTQLYLGDVLVTKDSNIVGVIAQGESRPLPKPSGEGGTDDYNELENKPSINGKALQGDSTLSELGIVTPKVVDGKIIFS